jgi:hypothetical protein
MAGIAGGLNDDHDCRMGNRELQAELCPVFDLKLGRGSESTDCLPTPQKVE